MKNAIIKALKALFRAAMNAWRKLLGMAPLGPDVTESVEDVVDAKAEDAVEDDEAQDAHVYNETLADRLRLAASLRLEGASTVHLFAGSDETELAASAWLMWMPTDQLQVVAVATDAALHAHLSGRLIPGVGPFPRIATHRQMAGLEPAPEMAPDPVREARVASAKRTLADRRAAVIRDLEREGQGLDEETIAFFDALAERDVERA